MPRTKENLWPFTEREIPRVKLKSGWTVGRANEEAFNAGYKGTHSFDNWLVKSKLDDRSSGQIAQLRRSYGEGVVKEHEDSVKKASRRSGHSGTGGGSSVSRGHGGGRGDVDSQLVGEVASALKNYGASAGVAREAAKEAAKSGGSFDDVFKRALDMTRHKQNPMGEGHWEEFDSEATAKKYARLMEGQGKKVTRFRKSVRVEENPARSAVQYRLAQAVLSGQSDKMPVSVARELVEKTPAHLRSAWSKHNPKSPEQMTASELNKALDKIDAESSKVTRQFIEAGRGHERPSEYLRMDDPLSRKARELYERRSELARERDLRYGPGAPSRLPTRRGFGPRQKYNPEPAAADMYESFHGRPSEQLVTFEEEEHYHEYLAELGICCGVLVETVNGDVQAIGLSGFMWSGKGKNAGFLEGITKSNPNKRYYVHVVQTGQGFMYTVKDRKFPAWEYHAIYYDRKEAAKSAKYLNSLEKNPKKKVKGPFHQASDLILGGASRLDDKLGAVLSGNPTDAVGPETTLLSSNEDGTQLYLVGGDQSLDLDALGITGDMATKELVTIGDVCKIHYETEKDFDDFEPTQYHHELGEETGDLPVLAYDRMNKRLLFIGGAYKIEKPWGETSPGIEN